MDNTANEPWLFRHVRNRKKYCTVTFAYLLPEPTEGHFGLLSLVELKLSLTGIVISVATIFEMLCEKFFSLQAIPGRAYTPILRFSYNQSAWSSLVLIVLLMRLSFMKNIRVPNDKIYKDSIRK